MFGLGPAELAVIAVILIFLFGAKKIPEIGKGLGGVIREFRGVRKELRAVDIEKDNSDDASEDKTEKGPGIVEDKIRKKMMDNVPVIKKAADIKDKVNRIKDVMK